jgi:hypothetical protein
MVEVHLEGRTVRGKLLQETDELVRVESIGGGTIGYRREDVKRIVRSEVPATSYHEQVGDHFRERAWEADDAPTMFAKARQAYRRALEHATEEGRRRHLEAKLENLARDRQDWQEDAIMREEVRKAAHEAELARLEKELTEQKLATLRRHEQVIRQMQDTVGSLQDETRRLGYAIETMSRRIEEVEDDIDWLARRDRSFITSTVFVQLKSAHRSLERKVDQLARDVRRD